MSRGHLFDKVTRRSIFHEGLKQKKAVYTHN